MTYRVNPASKSNIVLNMSNLPPSYDYATNSPGRPQNYDRNHLSVEERERAQERANISDLDTDDEPSRNMSKEESHERDEMHDETRELPEGYVRAYDPKVGVCSTNSYQSR